VPSRPVPAHTDPRQTNRGHRLAGANQSNSRRRSAFGRGGAEPPLDTPAQDGRNRNRCGDQPNEKGTAPTARPAAGLATARSASAHQKQAGRDDQTARQHPLGSRGIGDSKVGSRSAFGHRLHAKARRRTVPTGARSCSSSSTALPARRSRNGEYDVSAACGGHTPLLWVGDAGASCSADRAGGSSPRRKAKQSQLVSVNHRLVPRHP
jgi:hypothetical protein